MTGRIERTGGYTRARQYDTGLDKVVEQDSAETSQLVMRTGRGPPSTFLKRSNYEKDNPNGEIEIH